MDANQQNRLDRYDNDYIETYLLNYETLIQSAPELADEWPNMDEEEQVIQRSFAMSDWSKRYTLGELYRAGRLTSGQVTRLAELDQALLEGAGQVEICYGPSLPELVNRLLTWGTPLTESEGTIRPEAAESVLLALAETRQRYEIDNAPH